MIFGSFRRWKQCPLYMQFLFNDYSNYFQEMICQYISFCKCFFDSSRGKLFTAVRILCFDQNLHKSNAKTSNLQKRFYLSMNLLGSRFLPIDCLGPEAPGSKVLAKSFPWILKWILQTDRLLVLKNRILVSGPKLLYGTVRTGLVNNSWSLVPDGILKPTAARVTNYLSVRITRATPSLKLR